MWLLQEAEQEMSVVKQSCRYFTLCGCCRKLSRRWVWWSSLVDILLCVVVAGSWVGDECGEAVLSIFYFVWLLQKAEQEMSVVKQSCRYFTLCGCCRSRYFTLCGCCRKLSRRWVWWSSLAEILSGYSKRQSGLESLASWRTLALILTLL